MDDSDDDARYPPNPYPPNRRRPPSSSSNRSRLPARLPPPPVAYADDDDDADPPIDEPEDDDYPAGRRRIPDADADSSSDSRGKRRRLDSYALGFEFAPRAVAKPPPPLPPAPAARISTSEWTEDSTFVLLEAWGDRYIQNGRKSIRSDEWGEVAKKVCEVLVRTDAQCRNRLDTLKKKYRKEKARMSDGLCSDSSWVYFKKMDALMRSPSPPPLAVHHQPMRAVRQPSQPVRQLPAPPVLRQQPAPRLPYGVDAGEYVVPGARSHRPNGVDERRDILADSASEDYEDEDDDESDGPPVRQREKMFGGSEASYRMLANSIQKFSDLYEKMENNRRQQMTELDRMRKEFQRDLEAHKRQILERAHDEIAKIREEYGEEQDEEERSDEDEDNDDEVDGSA